MTEITNAILLQQYFINQLLPNFSKAMPSKITCQSLGYAILNGYENSNIIKKLEECKTYVNNKLYQGLSLLHLTALTSNTVVMDALCSMKGINKLPLDQKGNSPLHLRALIEQDAKNDPFLNIYSKACKLTSKQKKRANKYGGTYLQVNKLAFSQLKYPFSTDSITKEKYFEKNSYSYLEVDPQCQGTHFTFVDQMVSTPKDMIDSWKLFNPKFKFDTELSKEYTKYLKSKPLLKIAPQEDMGCGVIANQDFKIGEVIGEFFGHLQSESSRIKNLNPDYLYSLSVENEKTGKSKVYQIIDPVEYRSALAMANDGVPNMIANTIYNVGAVAERILFSAIKDIKIGEALVWSYGKSSRIRLQNVSQNNLKRSEKFLKNYPLRGFKEILVDGNRGAVNAKNINMLNAAYQYILSTPSVLLRCYQSGVITDKDIQAYRELNALQVFSRTQDLQFIILNTALLHLVRLIKNSSTKIEFNQLVEQMESSLKIFRSDLNPNDELSRESHLTYYYTTFWMLYLPDIVKSHDLLQSQLNTSDDEIKENVLELLKTSHEDLLQNLSYLVNNMNQS